MKTDQFGEQTRQDDCAIIIRDGTDYCQILMYFDTQEEPAGVVPHAPVSMEAAPRPIRRLTPS